MKANGFTLVELIVTIAIMLLIFSIATPTILSASEKKKKEQCESYVEQFETLAELYVSDHKNEVATKESTNISLQKLYDDDYLDKIPINPQTEDKFDRNSTVNITRKGTLPNYTFEYKYSVSCE